MSATDIDVLIVEDDQDLRMSFAAILQDAGYGVAQAEDGFVALEQLRTVEVGAIILDVRMPVMDGYQLLDKLDHPPPVMLITAHGWDAEAVARREKIFEFVRKPIDPADLIALVGRALRT